MIRQERGKQKLIESIARAEMARMAASRPAVEVTEPTPIYLCRKCYDKQFVEFLTFPDGHIEQVHPGQWGYMAQAENPTTRLSRATCICVDGKATQERVYRLLQGGSVPVQYHETSFETWEALSEADRAGKEEIYIHCREYAAVTLTKQSSKLALVLSGSPGIGKSGLAACALMERARRGQVVMWINWRTLLRKLYAAIRDPDKDVSELVDAACTVPLLLIDDLGDTDQRKDVSDFVRSTLYDIISARWDNKLEFIITTNLSLDQLEDQFGERIASRIEGIAVWVNGTGKDLRKTDE